MFLYIFEFLPQNYEAQVGFVSLKQNPFIGE